MFAEIITIGDELLIGQVTDTNSVFISKELNKAGVSLIRKTMVSDEENEILQALSNTHPRAKIIFTTGGLGPTKDDLTKKVLCDFFETSLEFFPEVYQQVEAIFRSRGREVSETNKSQAYQPKKARILNNPNGTAPGLMFEKGDHLYFSLPGVPHEMKPMLTDQVIPVIKERFELPFILHRTILTQGIGESYLSDMISSWESALPIHMKLAYLPSPGMVRLRISAKGDDKHKLSEEVNAMVESLMDIAGKYIFGFEENNLEDITGRLLSGKKLSVACAESCTGGYISHLITSVPGSSAYFHGSVIAYSNDIKISELSVNPETLEKFGAVSEETVREMAQGIRTKYKVDYSIACSGIAGPDGGTEEKPVGTVWIAVAGPKGIEARKLQLGQSRERVIRESALHALNLLRKTVLSD